MTTAVDTATSPFLAKAEDIGTTNAAPGAQSEVQRLAETLQPVLAGDLGRCLLFEELSGGTASSSVWLTTSVASALSNHLKRAVYVFSIVKDSRGGGVGTPAEQEGCIFEAVPADHAGVGFAERLRRLRSSREIVLLHSTTQRGVKEGALPVSAVDGVVLLAHASRTRRAALQAAVLRLTQAGAPLLGCVLLDRTHPIPEKLYHLL